MSIFFNVFIKSIAFFLSILTIIIIISLSLSFFGDRNNNFTTLNGEESSTNIIAIIELNGIIIETNSELSNLTNPFVISPQSIKENLEEVDKISPKAVIFSINSPGGTVSASKKIYDIIKNYKKNNSDMDIFIHTDELLASGGYWVATAADGIYANYGSIIGSIGVKGPDWFFYDKPKTLSTGIFGNTIETENGIKVFSNKAGKSKDIFDPFRKPTKNELEHLQNMVDEIYNDFIRIVSKERKIEKNILEEDIGALIYTAKQAYRHNLIDDELTLEKLINKTIKDKNLKDYKVIKIINVKNSLVREILTSSFNKKENYFNYECLSLRSSMTAILSYEATGC
ncbi:S49 family peptidase [Alphaproteobacteria bacterium]|nr:S49 family peptidase [Alphaproteobacteria bacterium]